MKNYIKRLLTFSLCVAMMLTSQNVFASDNAGSMARGTYMSSATVYGKVVDENDVIGRALVICLDEVEEIEVVMYLQQSYGSTWKNVTSAYNMNAADTNELDQSAIVYNVSPGTYRVYIEVLVMGYDGLFDTATIATASFTINT